MTGDRAIRAATAAVVCAVAGFAAAVSYAHIYGLGREHGQDGTAARLLPLSVDGLILAESLILLHEARNGRDAPGLARVMLWLGIAATVGANIAYGARYGLPGAVISAWPAVAFIGAVETVMQLVRRTRLARPAAPRPAAARDEEPPGFAGPGTRQAGPDPAAAPGPALLPAASPAGISHGDDPGPDAGDGTGRYPGRHELPAAVRSGAEEHRPAQVPAFPSGPGPGSAGPAGSAGGRDAALIAAGIAIRQQAEHDGVPLSRKAFAGKVREHGYTIANGRLSWLRAACGFPAADA